MAARAGAHTGRWYVGKRVFFWFIGVAALVTLLVLLTLAVEGVPASSQDHTVLDWVKGRDVPLISGISSVISAMTNNYPAMGLGILAIGFLWLIGMTRAAIGFALVGGVVGVIAFLGDLTLGEIVDRSRPLSATSGTSYPSGHVYGSTVFFGFWGFLGFYYGLKRKILIPLLGVLLLLILAVGFSRMFENAHWPSDVAAAYLLGGIWLLVLIPMFVYLQKASWLPAGNQYEDLTVAGCEGCRIERSIASKVVLDPQRGTATKIYQPPGIVRLLYWVAFQARFPYESNSDALHAAQYRREIASYLTRHRFGKDLVAHVTSEGCNHGKCSFVTEFVPGELADNGDEVRRFLAEVTELFAEAGLAVWQINPRNPHAHTNLIRTASGDFVIIDLESAVVTPVPAPGQWRSSLRRGALPIFDDIDFERLRHYVSDNEDALAASLGRDGLAGFREAVESGEKALRAWQDSEPRLWGRLIRGVYRLFNWMGPLQHIAHAISGADRAAQVFIDRGIDRWESEGRITQSDADSLRAEVSSPESRNALHHMGVHLVISIAIAVPVPGLRSLARAAWTAFFWAKTQVGRVRGRGTRGPNIHSPLVMILALAPIVGGDRVSSIPPAAQETPRPPDPGSGRRQDAFRDLHAVAPGPEAGPRTTFGRRMTRSRYYMPKTDDATCPGRLCVPQWRAQGWCTPSAGRYYLRRKRCMRRQYPGYRTRQQPSPRRRSLPKVAMRSWSDLRIEKLRRQRTGPCTGSPLSMGLLLGRASVLNHRFAD